MSFPAMISNEPPPLDSDEEEELEEEYLPNGLHLDVSADPSPMASPRKGVSKAHLDSPLARIPSPDKDLLNDNMPPLINGTESKGNNDVVQPLSPADEYLNIINSHQSENGEEFENDSSESGLSRLPVELEDSKHSLNVNETESVVENFVEPDSDKSEGSIANGIQDEIAPISLQSSRHELESHIRNSSGPSETPNNSEQIAENIEACTRDRTYDENFPSNTHFNGFDTGADVLEPVSSGAVSRDSPVRHNFDNPLLDDDEDDFGDFDAAPNVQQSNDLGQGSHFSPAALNCSIPQAAVQKPEVVDDDDFGDFSSTAVQHASIRNPDITLPGPSLPVEANESSVPDKFSMDEEEDDDFGNFTASEAKDAFSSAATSLPTSTTVTHRRESLQLAAKFEPLIKSVFSHPGLSPMPPAEEGKVIEPIDKLLENSASNGTWTHVQEFEDSHCLLYKWPRSRINQILLKSLNIDTSTIIYSERFGTIEVPKFATSLVDGPLQPEFASTTPEFQKFQGAGGVASKGFDESLEFHVQPEEVKPDSALQRETTKILEQLPDLSYMLAKTLVFPRNPKY